LKKVACLIYYPRFNQLKIELILTPNALGS
jgi:hypothetical protein